MAHGLDEPRVGIGSVPSPSEAKNCRKRRNMNKKPSQRPRMKKHRPKILDDSKPKKVPKTSTRTPKTPNQVQERRKHSKKNMFTGSTSCMQSSTSYGHEDPIIALNSCKRSLDFDYHLVDKESVSKSSSLNFDLGEFDFFSKIVTSKRNTPRRSRFQTKHLRTSLEDLSGAKKHVRKYVYFYQRRKKSSSISTLQVYRRKFRVNQCLQNSKKSGPVFPRMFKKPRSKRKKANMDGNWWYMVKPNLHTNKRFLHVFSVKKRKQSIGHTRRRKNIMDLSIAKTMPWDSNRNDLYVREMTGYLIGKMENLDISRQDKELVVRDHNVIGALLKTDPPGKHKVLPKVELDEETLRVWKLLMENDGNKPVEETDKDKEEWWERERKVFRGRVDSFIAKMHLIQGNRQFSPWKGSVVDSVVGVYLTQNVSDHLSSSAFMSLAARFPAKSRSKEVDDDGEVATSQESVRSNTKVDGGFFMNNETEQDMRTLCSDVSNETKPKQKGVSDPIMGQDKPCVNGNLKTFRELLDMEELEYLKQFYSLGNDESPLNDSDLNPSKEGEEQSAASYDLPSSHESCSTMPDVNIEREVVVEKNGGNKHSESEFIVQQCDAVCMLHSEVNNDQSMKAIPLDTGKKNSRIEEKQEMKTDWERLRRSYCKNGGKETNGNNMDAVDWDAVRHATVEEIAETIVERGMNNVLAARIKEFLERMVKDHGTIDLEWLRDIPPDKAKEFLLSIHGIGLKSVECVRLLTLHHLAFPVDTNVGRVATRLGWVPLQPLPEEVQIHLLNLYPMVDNIQKYLFPRLCTIDQRTLYELHYQLITFGKVFCTKINPNCNACPMRAECRHYASAFASARLALPGSKECSVTSIVPAANKQNHSMPDTPPSSSELELSNLCSSYHARNSEPIIEIPPSPEHDEEETLPIICDIEDYFRETNDEPTIRLNTEEFRETLQDIIDVNGISLPEADVSKALVALTAEAASVPLPRMKFVAKLRTVHFVYELPDSHPSLVGFDEREHDDPSPYLLAVWLPGETSKCMHNLACSSSNNDQEETVKATILIPCRTATRGRFPLNGTYFQVNEVFADDKTSQIPMDVPRSLLWDLPRRYLACGTSATSILKALTTTDIQRCFWKASICVRGFNRETRQPRPLHRRFHISTTAVAAENRKTAKR